MDSPIKNSFIMQAGEKLCEGHESEFSVLKN